MRAQLFSATVRNLFLRVLYCSMYLNTERNERQCWSESRQKTYLSYSTPNDEGKLCFLAFDFFFSKKNEFKIL